MTITNKPSTEYQDIWNQYTTVGDTRVAKALIQASILGIEPKRAYAKKTTNSETDTIHTSATARRVNALNTFNNAVIKIRTHANIVSWKTIATLAAASGVMIIGGSFAMNTLHHNQMRSAVVACTTARGYLQTTTNEYKKEIAEWKTIRENDTSITDPDIKKADQLAAAGDALSTPPTCQSDNKQTLVNQTDNLQKTTAQLKTNKQIIKTATTSYKRIKALANLQNVIESASKLLHEATGNVANAQTIDDLNREITAANQSIKENISVDKIIEHQTHIEQAITHVQNSRTMKEQQEQAAKEKEAVQQSAQQQEPKSSLPQQSAPQHYQAPAAPAPAPAPVPQWSVPAPSSSDAALPNRL